ncbi:unnamed protein product [Cyprideis torosa]|uniref:Uncharacterized protein n=1 Tax=Cyprideis torosa TaxID=163714 RepID=A0A7R8W722_9CRUS|nr:unnamed protein product [Cyprideis torosa]CAG0887110.1 unnamed protein product [Cyprideis torosa]
MSRGRPGRSENEGNFELESQFFLRMPREPGKKLEEILMEGDMTAKDRLKIELESDMRKGKVYLDDRAYRAKLWDLPTVVESLKTVDRKNFYKTADICQMLQVYEDESSEEEDVTELTKAQREKKEKKKYSYPHGITPPLKNIRRRRFRKTLKKKYADLPEIEKEVKRLLRMDLEAVDVKWELVEDTEDDGFGKQATSKGTEAAGGTSQGDQKNRQEGREVSHFELFGGALSESGSDEDEGERPTLIASREIEEDEDSRFSGVLKDDDDTNIGPLDFADDDR